MMALALALAALSGFIALSYEVLWFRLVSFVSQGTAAAFGLALGAYLLGLAGGALLSVRYRRAAGTHDRRQLRAVAAFGVASNVVAFLVAPAMAFAVGHVHWALTLPIVAIAALLLGTNFPLLCHFGVAPDDRAGAGLSYLYLANILGSAAGSLLTGFVLMDHLPFAQITLILVVTGLTTSAVTLALSRLSRKALLGWLNGVVVATLVVLAAAPVLYTQLWARLYFKQDFGPDTHFSEVVENKSGVITVTPDGRIFGGGAYDGKFDVDVKDWDWIVRPYALSAFHPAPRRVLMFGLSSGAWAQILAHNPEVEHLTVVEINPGYLDLIPRHPNVASLIDNPKVDLVVDDGRRWLRAHPDARFDAIVFNVTHSWRAFSSNVLSVEFLESIRRHLAPGGVYFYNTTWSKDAMATALKVFPHAVMVVNSIAVSEQALTVDKARWRDVLARYTLDGRRLFDPNSPVDQLRLDEIVNLVDTMGQDLETDIRFLDRAQIEARAREGRVITNDNMITEYGFL